MRISTAEYSKELSSYHEVPCRSWEESRFCPRSNVREAQAETQPVRFCTQYANLSIALERCHDDHGVITASGGQGGDSARCHRPNEMVVTCLIDLTTRRFRTSLVSLAPGDSRARVMPKPIMGPAGDMMAKACRLQGRRSDHFEDKTGGGVWRGIGKVMSWSWS